MNKSEAAGRFETSGKAHSNKAMAFVIIMILLSGMGAWVLYQLVLVRRASKAKAPAEIGMRKTHPVLYWMIVAAQTLFLIQCLYRLFHLIFR